MTLTDDLEATIPMRDLPPQTRIFDGKEGVVVLRIGRRDYPFATRRDARAASTMTPRQLAGFQSTASALSVYGEPQ